MLKFIALGLIGAVVALAVYVRIAPLKPEDWHVAFYPQPPGDRQSAGGYQVVIAVDDPKGALTSLDRLIMATPRTTRLAGSVDEGMVTYVTRSRIWGFPDLTTIWAGPDDTAEGGHGPLLKIHGRLRFGQSDLGVNRARIQEWVNAISGVNS